MYYPVVTDFASTIVGIRMLWKEWRQLWPEKTFSLEYQLILKNNVNIEKLIANTLPGSLSKTKMMLCKKIKYNLAQ